MSRGSTKLKGYRIEARHTADSTCFLHRPVCVGEAWLTEQWKTLDWARGKHGVPNDQLNPIAVEQGVLTYGAACALMAWAAATVSRSSVEFRLVRVEFECSWTVSELGVGETISFDYETEKGLEFTARATNTETEQ